MKKKLAIGLIAVMAAGLIAGCGASAPADTAAIQQAASEGTEEADDTAAPTGGTVELWNDKLANTDQTTLDAITNQAKASTGYDIKEVPYPDTAAYQTALQQSINGESAPGLFTWWSGAQLQSLVDANAVADLTDVWTDLENQGISPDIKDAFTYDGKAYAVPWSILYNTIIYNKGIFDQYNLTAPTTFDEFINDCDVLLENGVTPIALKNDGWAGFIWFQAMLASKDASLYDGICDGSVAYNDGRVVEVMQKWEDMLKKGYFSTPMEYADVCASLAKGNVAMMLEPHVEFTGLAKNYGLEAGKDVDAFVLPAMDGGKVTIFFETAPLCVAANSAQKDNAMEALKNWFVPEMQNVLYTELGYTNTSNISVDNEPVKNILNATADPTNCQMRLRYYENTPTEVRDPVLDALMKFELQNADAQTTCDTMQQAADAVFAQ